MNIQIESQDGAISTYEQTKMFCVWSGSVRLFQGYIGSDIADHSLGNFKDDETATFARNHLCQLIRERQAQTAVMLGQVSVAVVTVQSQEQAVEMLTELSIIRYKDWGLPYQVADTLAKGNT